MDSLRPGNSKSRPDEVEPRATDVATSQMGDVIDYLRRAGLAEDEADRTDGQLLECFVSRRDEAAVAALVRRHGPMVWGVCRRVLRDHQDAEDAFQATFLVLVRRAAAISPREMVGNWLYGVARQTALKARAAGARRQAREKQLNQGPEPEAQSEPDLWRDLQPLLDRELSRLPDKYRLAVVLCDLEGRSRKEAASQLGIPEGTLSSRLTTARATLARRLARHGLALSGGALAAVLSQKAAAGGLPPSVATSAIRAATDVAAGQAAAGGVVSAKVAALTDGVLKTMLLKKLATLTGVLLLLGVLGLGSTAFPYGALGAGQSRRQETSPEGPAPQARPEDAPRKVARDDKVLDRSQGGAADDKGKGAKPEAKEPAANHKVQALLKERLAILKGMQSRAEKLYQAGQASQGALQQINLRVLKAELDLCETDKERVAVHEKVVAVLKGIEQQAGELAKRGAAAAGTLQEARLNRLEAEVALERARAKSATPPK
jgi:RNA polymerase sigma factor (sigma-70 family)